MRSFCDKLACRCRVRCSAPGTTGAGRSRLTAAPLKDQSAAARSGHPASLEGSVRPMPEFRHILAATAIIATAAFTGPGAQAASQVLGLVASNGLPTPLQCEDGVCAGHFSSFCLQQGRPAPSANSEYSLAPGGSLTLILTQADGRQTRLPGNEFLSLRSLIGFTS